jgi:hypothetical protein
MILTVDQRSNNLHRLQQVTMGKSKSHLTQTDQRKTHKRIWMKANLK